MLVRDLESFLLARFPRRDAEAWDHVGLSVGDPDAKYAVCCALLMLPWTRCTLRAPWVAMCC